MKNLWPLAIGMLVLGGCSTQEITPIAPPARLSATLDPSDLPDLETRSDLELFSSNRESASVVRIGTDLDRALAAFPRPGGAHDFSDLPSTLPTEFSARGWETANEGFGVILYNARVASAVHELRRTDRAMLDELVERYNKAIPEKYQITPLAGARIRYWFWEDGRRRLMICGVDTPKDGYSVTVALGDRVVLDALRMSPATATADLAAAEQTYVEGTIGQNSQETAKP